MDPMPDISQHIKAIIEELGEDSRREGLLKTPSRSAKALQFLTSGYRQTVKEIINDAIFETPEASSSEMVLVKDIELYSLCEHHLLPFFGKCHVAYVPQGRIIGLSKVARIVDVFAKRFQVQERLTAQVAQTLMDHLQPKGVAVVMEASHLCMMMRGVQKQNAFAKTSCLLGVFQQAEYRTQFFDLIRA